MSIVIHFIAAPFEQSFSYEGTIEEFQRGIYTIRNLVNVDKAGENIFNVTPSGISTEFGVSGSALYKKLFDLVSKADPRLLRIKNDQFEGNTSVDNGLYTYQFKVGGIDSFTCQVNSQNSVDHVLNYIRGSRAMFEIFEQFLISVRNDFPADTAVPPVPKEAPAAEPLFTPETEVAPRVPVEVKNGRPVVAAQREEKMQELGILVCRIGNPIIEVVLRSPIAHRLQTTAFAETLKGYLDQSGVLTTADNGRRLLAVSEAQASRFEDLIRSAVQDHNALEGAEFGREEYLPGKEVPGRIYL